MNIISSLSMPGKPDAPNEDRAGVSGACAWVIDGATGLTDGKQYVAQDGDSDASWLAEQLNSYFMAATIKSAGDIKPMLLEARQHALRLYQEQAREIPEQPYAFPSCSLQFAFNDGRVLHYAFLGDCTLMLRNEDGLFVSCGDETHHAADALKMERMKELHAQGVTDLAEVRQGLLPIIREHRASVNQNGGHSSFCLRSDFAGTLTQGQVDIAGASDLVLMSDGFYALVDKYGAYDDAGLYEAMLSKGFEGLYEELRSIEDKDPQCLQYPRFKKGDDATAVHVKLS